MNKYTSINGITSKPVLVLFWFAFGLVLNVAGASLASHLGLPIYIDCTGTIVATICGGLLPGVLTGFVSNIINTISYPISVYYMFANMVTAMITAWIFNKKKWFTPRLLILVSVTMGIVCGGYTAVMIRFLNDQYNSAPVDAIASYFQKAGVSPLVSSVIGNICMDIVDKSLTVILASIILYILMRAGIYREEEAKSEKADIGIRISLQTKLVFILSAVILFVGVAALGIGSWLFQSYSIQDHTSLGKGVAELVADQIDPDRVDTWILNGENEPDYLEVENRLKDIRDSYEDIQYVYVYKIIEDGCHVVFDLDTEELQGDDPGAVVKFDEGFRPLLQSLLAGETIDPIVTNDKFGWLLTIYTPVRDKNGKCVCYAAIDFSMDRIKISTEEYMAKLAALFLASVLLALVVLILYSRNNIIYPLNGMAVASSLELNSEEDRKKCIENMEKLSIHTGDEVEHLYTELLNNMKDTVSYMETIRQRDEDLNKLQDGLIKVLAEAVESRDLCTGNHIKRTAAYVRLIMDELKKEGISDEVLTDEYIQSVIRSAPLHDVGKIKVPDAILNKPGRLTDEEFDTIKTHTTSGVDIIDEAINVVPNPMYLKEARDMAYYHHEKWDGRGYPCGIKGEEIPLSARVMAVADVFDALVSKRSYKKEFPIEKAFDIIEEGSGSHFDPVVVNAFMARSDDVKKLVDEFAEEEAKEDANNDAASKKDH